MGRVDFIHHVLTLSDFYFGLGTDALNACSTHVFLYMEVIPKNLQDKLILKVKMDRGSRYLACLKKEKVAKFPNLCGIQLFLAPKSQRSVRRSSLHQDS